MRKTSPLSSTRDIQFTANLKEGFLHGLQLGLVEGMRKKVGQHEPNPVVYRRERVLALSRRRLWLQASDFDILPVRRRGDGNQPYRAATPGTLACLHYIAQLWVAAGVAA